jgi:hypothetical protein
LALLIGPLRASHRAIRTIRATALHELCNRGTPHFSIGAISGDDPGACPKPLQVACPEEGDSVACLDSSGLWQDRILIGKDTKTHENQ